MNTDGNGLWSDGNNWSPTTPTGGPNGNYTVTIPCCLGSPVGGAILTSNVSIVSLAINVNGGLYITNGAALNITGTSITNNGTLAIQDVDGYTGGGEIIISGTVTLSGSGTTVFNTTEYTAGISGTGTLINLQAIKGQGGGGDYRASAESKSGSDYGRACDSAAGAHQSHNEYRHDLRLGEHNHPNFRQHS